MGGTKDTIDVVARTLSGVWQMGQINTPRQKDALSDFAQRSSQTLYAEGPNSLLL